MKDPMMIPFRLERNSTGGWVLRAADDGDLAIQIAGDSVVIQGIESIETFEERGHREERRVPSQSYSGVLATAQASGIDYDQQGDRAIRMSKRNYRRLQAELATGRGGARFDLEGRQTSRAAQTKDQNRALRPKAAVPRSPTAPVRPAIRIPKPVYRAGAPEYKESEAREFLAASLKSARLFFHAAVSRDSIWETCVAGEMVGWDTTYDLKTDYQHLLLADCYVVFSAHYTQPSQRANVFRITGPSLFYCIDVNRNESRRYVTLIHVPQFVSEFYRWLEPVTFAALTKIASRHLPQQ